MIFIALRLFFAIPAMYVDQQNAVDSIKHSFQITKGHINQVLIIFLTKETGRESCLLLLLHF